MSELGKINKSIIGFKEGWVFLVKFEQDLYSGIQPSPPKDVEDGWISNTSHVVH